MKHLDFSQIIFTKRGTLHETGRFAKHNNNFTDEETKNLGRNTTATFWKIPNVTEEDISQRMTAQ